MEGGRGRSGDRGRAKVDRDERRYGRNKDSRSVERGRTGGRGSLPPPEPAYPPSSWKRPAVPPPRRPSHSYPRVPEQVGRSFSYSPSMGHRVSRSRSAGQRRLAPGLDVKARPEKRPRSLTLGLTTGITAAGAWAARFEIASMLEAKCNPNELVEAIRAGHEGPHVLSMTQHEERSTVGSASAGSLQETESRKDYRDDIPEDLFSDQEGWDKELGKQRAILESLGAGKEALPPCWRVGSTRVQLR